MNSIIRQLNNLLYKHIRKDENLCFIVGAPRSGTTWLWGILTSCKGITSLDLDDLAINESSYNGKKRKTSETGIFFKLDDGDIFKVYSKKRKRFNDVIILEKTPLHLLYIERIKKLFPKAKVIILLRNPYSVIASMLNTKFFKFANSLEDATNQYYKYYSILQKYFDEDNFHIVRYEDMKKNTTKEIKEVLEFLHLQIEDKKLERILKKNDSKTKVDQKDAFRKGEIESYKTELSKQDQDFIKKKLVTLVKEHYFL
ncbi:MAG TPA: sulfotransferase [Candidatus Dojkabacteria bacterium]